MNYVTLRDALARPDLRPEEMFGVLRGISRFVNDKETYSIGRDLVIRALPRQELCSDFEKSVLVSLVRTVGLFPYMTEVLEYADSTDRLAYELHRPDHMPEVFHSLQARIYYLLRAGSNVVLSASTSAGKSLLIDAMIALGKFRKVVIIVPTLALIDETRKRLAAKFKERCRIITHPTQVADLERTNLYILTQERALQRIDLDNVNFVVVDEFYKIDLRRETDAKRAEDLNLIFHRLASTGAQFYMLGPNVEAVRGLGKYDIHFVSTSYATVAADIAHFNLPRNGDERAKKLVELCRNLQEPTLIYCQGPGSASKIAALLMRELPQPHESACSEAADWIMDNFHPEWIGGVALKTGIGIHHGGIPRALQQHMVRLFNGGHIRFLVCTSMLIEGVNTAAKNVIIYDKRRGSPTIDFFTYKNIQGRAGRMGRYFIGKIFVLEKPVEESEVIVDYALGNQGPDTPLSLLLQLNDADLSERSRDRVEQALENSFLSEDTIRANSFIHPDVQNRIAKEIVGRMRENPRLFSWRGLPNGDQLQCVSDIIMRHISGVRINRAGISSPEQLIWYIRRVAHRQGLRHLLHEVTAGKQVHQDLNKLLDMALGIVRNVIMFRVPQDLMAISRIQSEVAGRLKLPAGDYGFYAENLENLFLPSVLAALEEYGLPRQIAKKISDNLAPHHDLDDVLDRLRVLRTSSVEGLTPFERRIIETVQKDI